MLLLFLITNHSMTKLTNLPIIIMHSFVIEFIKNILKVTNENNENVLA